MGNNGLSEKNQKKLEQYANELYAEEVEKQTEENIKLEELQQEHGALADLKASAYKKKVDIARKHRAAQIKSSIEQKRESLKNRMRNIILYTSVAVIWIALMVSLHVRANKTSTASTSPVPSSGITATVETPLATSAPSYAVAPSQKANQSSANDAPIIYDEPQADTDVNVNTDSSSNTSTTNKPSVNNPDAVYYSTNSEDTVDNGNSGVYAYVADGTEYKIYYIIDFDAGYVYRFLDGNGDNTCMRVPIVSGNLNDGLLITYHDSDATWTEALHFKWVNAPGHLIYVDHNYDEWDYYPTDLSAALKIKNGKNLVDY